MTDNQDNIDQLLRKLEALLKRQDDFLREINSLSSDINKLKISEESGDSKREGIKQDKSATNTDFEIKSENVTTDPHSIPQQKVKEQTKHSAPKVKLDLEKFIGENLINKVGIAITIIGVAIGAKYSIENDLISPLTRTILGYLIGIVLLVFGIKLKKKYESYSAVLVSGAIAIIYFITYSAYSFYSLIPQSFAFALMLVFTAFSVVAAINYNRQLIAHIGLVGAYAVPFLLSEGSGDIAILFSYMAIINIGILIISFKKYWKPLFYSSLWLTWLMYFLWYVTNYETKEHFELGLTFLFIFFSTFYMIFLAYKLLQKEKFEIGDIILLLTNSFIFYGLGYGILKNHETGEQLLGIFTLFNALVHFIISALIYKRKLADKNLLQFVSGLVLVFITIAIPVQLDGNWVTLLWAGQAALLFWIGRTKNIPVYERLSYPLMLLAFFSIAQDWILVYDSYYPENPGTITPLLNINFLTSLLFAAAFGFINFLNQNKNYQSVKISKNRLSKFVSFSIPAILLITLYCMFRMEVINYWSQLYTNSSISVISENEKFYNHYRNYDLNKFKTIWILNYSLVFVSILSFINFRMLKNKRLGMINLSLNTLTILVFLIQGLYVLSELRESYLEQTLSEYYQRGVFHLGIRYVSYLFIVLALVSCHKYVRQDFIKRNFKMAFDFLLHTTVLWIASSELINIMDLAESSQSYKLGLSILWGAYSLFLIAIGIWKHKKYLRIWAISVFVVTLVKLFFYDISHLDTISKTIVFVSLGVLLLITSFLYNKYKHIISNEIDN
tara:strand:+ start:4300 stop:6654 length:2355 start_codon:yes stop_codon:yes gene_type:complete